MGKTGFFKKAFGTFFPPFRVLTNCKVSGKTNERASRKAGTNGQADERYSQIWANLGQIWLILAKMGHF